MADISGSVGFDRCRIFGPFRSWRPPRKPNVPEGAAKSTKSPFAQRFDDAFRWLASRGKLKANTHESEFAKICGTDIRNIRRWRDGPHAPNRTKWETARIGLAKAGLPQVMLDALAEAWNTGGDEDAPESFAAVSVESAAREARDDGPDGRYYVSYAWADESDPRREAEVDRLCAEAEARDRKILRDKTVLVIAQAVRGSGISARVRRIACRAWTPRRLAVSMTERTSA